VLAQIVTVEDDTGLIGEPLGGNPAAIALGVILPQPLVGLPAIQPGLRGLAGGVVVIVDAPPR
jgi:hypothetical protein